MGRVQLRTADLGLLQRDKVEAASWFLNGRREKQLTFECPSSDQW